jgi:hypothetical protein
MGEMLVKVTGGKFTEEGFVFQAKDARNALINITARGTIVKPDKQPLPCSSCEAAAVCRYTFVGRARGMRLSLHSGSSIKGPGSNDVY